MQHNVPSLLAPKTQSSQCVSYLAIFREAGGVGMAQVGIPINPCHPPPPGISGRTVPDVVMPQAAQQRARMSSGRQLEVPPFVDAGSLGALLKVASNWWSRQVAGGPVARGCRLEDAGIWRSHRSRRCRQLEVTARGCRQLEVSPLEAAGSWRFQRSWIQTTGGPTARGSRQLEVPPLEVACSGGPAPRDWLLFGRVKLGQSPSSVPITLCAQARATREKSPATDLA
eukprot:gene7802-biopygen18072